MVDDTGPFIRTEGIWKEYDGHPVLKGINMDIRQGAMVLIQGRSGSGKTTLLSIIGCMDLPTRGKLIIEGEDATTMSHKQLAHLRLNKIGFIFQDHNLINSLTVEENIMLPMRIAKYHNGGNRVSELLETFDITYIRDKKPKYISGGEKQRAAIARALANKPDILLADEPIASLDTVNAENVMEAFKKANEKYGTTVLLSCHDPLVVKHASEKYVLEDGLLINEPINSPPE